MTDSQRPIQYRLATRDDHGAIVGLYYAMDQMHAEAVPNLCKPGLMPPLSQGALDRQLAKSDQQLWVAMCENRIVGLLNMVCEEAKESHPFLREPKTIHVHTVIVEQGYRHLGIGNSLLSIAEQWAKEKDARRLGLSVFAFNEPARKLYDRFGFQEAKFTMVKDV